MNLCTEQMRVNAGSYLIESNLKPPSQVLSCTYVSLLSWVLCEIKASQTKNSGRRPLFIPERSSFFNDI
jgi:hypothetical protein